MEEIGHTSKTHENQNRTHSKVKEGKRREGKMSFWATWPKASPALTLSFLDSHDQNEVNYITSTNYKRKKNCQEGSTIS
jgi:hypothetical protein